eukprot:711976-Amorphochlora_amoeboformis.AAC.1
MNRVQDLTSAYGGIVKAMVRFDTNFEQYVEDEGRFGLKCLVRLESELKEWKERENERTEREVGEKDQDSGSCMVAGRVRVRSMLPLGKVTMKVPSLWVA